MGGVVRRTEGGEDLDDYEGDFDSQPKEREVRISKEKRRLWKFYKELIGHRRALAEKLVDRASAQLVMMEDLERYIQEHGYTEEYQNGENQSGKKQSSEMQTYLTLSQRYNQTIKQLDDMLPCEATTKASDNKLTGFIAQRPVIFR